MIKAFEVTTPDRDLSYLVFAESANRARYLAEQVSVEFNGYIGTRARRRQDYDGVYGAEKVIHENGELPPGVEPFFDNFEDRGLLK